MYIVSILEQNILCCCGTCNHVNNTCTVHHWTLVYTVDVHSLLFGNQFTKNGCRRAQCYVLVIAIVMQDLAEHSTPIQSLGCMFDVESASTVALILSASSPQYIV